MRFEKSFKSNSNNQLLECWELKWFDITDILHTIMSKSEHY
jgi:hypothetical protein